MVWVLGSYHRGRVSGLRTGVEDESDDESLSRRFAAVGQRLIPSNYSFN